MKSLPKFTIAIYDSADETLILLYGHLRLAVWLLIEHSTNKNRDPLLTRFNWVKGMHK